MQDIFFDPLYSLFYVHGHNDSGKLSDFVCSYGAIFLLLAK